MGVLLHVHTKVEHQILLFTQTICNKEKGSTDLDLVYLGIGCFFNIEYFCALSQRVYGQSNVYNCIDNRIISLCCVRFFRFCTLTQGVYVQIRFKNNKPNLNSQTNNLMKEIIYFVHFSRETMYI